MKILSSETFYSAEELTEFVNIQNIEKKNIVSISTSVDLNGDPVFCFFYFLEE